MAKPPLILIPWYWWHPLCKNISPNIWEECFSNCSKYSKFIKLISKMNLDCMNWRSEQSVLISCNWHASILCLWDWDCLSWSIRECGNVRAEPDSGHCLLLDNHLFNYFYTSLIWPFSPPLPFMFEPNYRKLSFYPTFNCYFLKLLTNYCFYPKIKIKYKQQFYIKLRSVIYKIVICYCWGFYFIAFKKCIQAWCGGNN